MVDLSKKLTDVAPIMGVPCGGDEDSPCHADGRCRGCGVSRTVFLSYSDGDGCVVAEAGCPNCGGPCCEEIHMSVSQARLVFGRAKVTSLRRRERVVRKAHAAAEREFQRVLATS